MELKSSGFDNFALQLRITMYTNLFICLLIYLHIHWRVIWFVCLFWFVLGVLGCVCVWFMTLRIVDTLHQSRRLAYIIRHKNNVLVPIIQYLVTQLQKIWRNMIKKEWCFEHYEIIFIIEARSNLSLSLLGFFKFDTYPVQDYHPIITFKEKIS